MKRATSFLRSFLVAVFAVDLLAAQAAAAPLSVATPEYDQPTVLAQSDCYAIGQQVAAQNGGTLARARQSNQGGQAVCVIVILVPGKDGERPRRREIVVPLN
jgi:hypothetical protein